jgi:hypothetical protein
VKSTCSIVPPLAVRKSLHKTLPRNRASEPLVAPRGKPSPQAVVIASERLADRRQLRLVSFDRCREDALETIIVNSRKILTQEREAKFIRRRIAAHSSALVLQKKLKSTLPSCCGPSPSISFAIAMIASRSALSKVTANRRIASCQARNVLAFRSAPEKFKLIERRLYDVAATSL